MLPEMEIDSIRANVDEIQSMDLEEIARKKARAVFATLNAPVVVDDTGFYLDELQGLPGPFFKYFEDILGIEAPIKLLRESQNRKAFARTCIAYFDGTNEFVVTGEAHGSVTRELRGPEGAFGFDYCFIPDGETETFAEMGIEKKNTMSHRSRALQMLKERLSEISG